MLGKAREEIEGYKAMLKSREAEIEKLREEKAGLQDQIDQLRRQYTDEYLNVTSEHSAEIENLKADYFRKETSLNEEIENLRIDVKRLQASLNDDRKYQDYNERLLHPVKPDEIKKVYHDYDVITTPTFFKLSNEQHDIMWLIRRSGYIRRYTGQLPNFFKTPAYPALASDPYFEQVLPAGIESNIEVVFVERVDGRAFCFCPPIDADSIVVSFWVNPASDFAEWRDKRKPNLLVDEVCPKRADWRQISLVLPFPVGKPEVCIDQDLDDEDCVPTDVECVAWEYERTLRDACQSIYMTHFFYKNRRTLKNTEPTEERQVEKDD